MCFYIPTHQIFLFLMTGWVLSHRRRFVTDQIWSSGCTHRGHQQPLPSFLQQLGLEDGHDVLGAGPLDHPRARAYRDRRVGRRRHALPQTWFDDLRHGHASRSTYLQSGQALDQLGARLGGRDLDHPQSVLGPNQGMEFAVDLLLVPQPSRRHQRQKESPAHGREEEAVRFAFPSDPPGNRRGTGFSAGRLVSAATVHAHRRQCLWRAECAQNCRPTWT